jgi:hypothetical protein
LFESQDIDNSKVQLPYPGDFKSPTTPFGAGQSDHIEPIGLRNTGPMLELSPEPPSQRKPAPILAFPPQETVRKRSSIMSLLNDEPSDSRPAISKRFNDTDADEVVAAEEGSDTEYNPKSTRSRKSRANVSVSSLHQTRLLTNTYTGDLDRQLFPRKGKVVGNEDPGSHSGSGGRALLELTMTMALGLRP